MLHLFQNTTASEAFFKLTAHKKSLLPTPHYNFQLCSLSKQSPQRGRGTHNCDKGKIKNRSAASDGINGKALKSRWSECRRIPERAVTNGHVRNRLRRLLKIDTGKWCLARWDAVSIKVQRGVPPVCGKLINTKVIFIRAPTSGNSYIIRKDGE